MKKIVFLIVFVLLISCKHEDRNMSRALLDTINIGAAANDHSGDPLRTAFLKINNVIDKVNNSQTGVFNILDYGADPTGVANSTTAIRNACAASAAAGGTVIGSGIFLITDSIVISSNADFGSATFNINDDQKTAVVYYGHNLYSHTVTFPRVVQLHSRTAGTWPGKDIGIEIIDANECVFNVPWITQFHTGLKVTSEGPHGTVFCTFNIGLIAGCKLGIQVGPRYTGWTNDNIFINGNIASYSSDDAFAPVAGSRAILVDSSKVFSSDNNVFLKVGLEGNMWEYNVECFGVMNDFAYCRWETTIPKVKFSAVGTSYAVNNLIMRGYQTSPIQFTNDANCQTSGYWVAPSSYRMATVVAGTGITKDMLWPFMIYTQASAVDISASPQIAAGVDGQVITIMGRSQTNTLTLNDTGNLDLTGTWVGGADDTITLIYSALDGQWMEVSRSNNN